MVGAADVEGLIAEGAPGDEYEPEGEAIFEAIGRWATKDLVAVKVLPVLERVWYESFKLGDGDVASRRAALAELAGQIERFFGPQAAPQVR